MIQRAEEEKKRARAERFAPDLAAQQAEKDKKKKQVELLKKLVQALINMHKKGNVTYKVAESALKHGYKDPAAIFVDRLLNAPWSATAAALDLINGRLIVTMGIDHSNTVVGVYKLGEVTVIHCGPIGSGVGYETNLGDVT